MADETRIEQIKRELTYPGDPSSVDVDKLARFLAALEDEEDAPQ